MFEYTEHQLDPIITELSNLSQIDIFIRDTELYSTVLAILDVENEAEKATVQTTLQYITKQATYFREYKRYLSKRGSLNKRRTENQTVKKQTVRDDGNNEYI